MLLPLHMRPCRPSLRPQQVKPLTCRAGTGMPLAAPVLDSQCLTVSSTLPAQIQHSVAAWRRPPDASLTSSMHAHPSMCQQAQCCSLIQHRAS